MEQEKLDKLHNIEVGILDEIVRICDKYKLEYFLVGGTLLGAVRHKGFIPWDDDLDIGMPRKDYEIFLKVAKKELNEEYYLDSYKNNKKYWLPFCKIRKRNTTYKEASLANYNGDCAIWVDIFPLDDAKCDNSRIEKLQYSISEKIKRITSYKNNINVESSSKMNDILKKIISILPISWYTFAWQKVLTARNNEKHKYHINFGSQYGIKKQTHLKEKIYPLQEIEFEGSKYKAPKDTDYVLTKIYGKTYMQLPPMEKRVTHNPIEIKF